MMVTGYEMSFGVPLEDIFPEDDVHPALKSLLNLAIKSVISNACSVKEMINFLQGPLIKRLILKEKVQSARKNINVAEVPPGAFLWVLRHFLGLLPLPVLPQYADEQYFSWDELAELCTTELSHSFRHTINMDNICDKILENFKKLPTSNFVLICDVLNFLRCLSVWPRREPHVCKSSVKALVKYFSSAIFLRPYRPGYVTSTDKKYYPLMAVLIIFWPTIRQLCLKSKRNVVGLLTVCNDPLSCMFKKNYVWKTDKSIQTDFILDEDLSAQNLSYSYKSSACQTNFPKRNYTKRDYATPNSKCYCTCEHYYSEAFQNICVPPCYRQNYFEYVVTFNPSMHSCTSHLQEEPVRSYNDGQISECSDTSLKDDACNTADRNENVVSVQQDVNQNSNANVSLSPEVLSCDGEYIYDEYTECLYEEPKEEKADNTETVKEPPTNSNCAEHGNILDKISKIGWTYTAKENSLADQAKQGDENIASYVSPPMGWNIPKENYNIYFDDKLSNRISLDDKGIENASLKQLNDNEDGDNPQNLITETQISPIGTCISRKSLMSMSGVKSRLGFLKMFSPKRIKMKKTASEEQVASKIRYKKMDSARSTMF